MHGGERVMSLSLRKLVFERDSGICAACSADCEKIKRVYWSIVSSEAQYLYAQVLQLWEDRRAFWEADHIHETADGGPDALTNLQTLCVGCHLNKSGVSRTARAARAAQRAEEDRAVERANQAQIAANAGAMRREVALIATVRRVRVMADRRDRQDRPSVLTVKDVEAAVTRALGRLARRGERTVFDEIFNIP